MSVILNNTTRHAVMGFEHMLFGGHNYYIVIVKQGWKMMPQGGLRPVDEPLPFHLAEVFDAAPERGAVIMPSDLVPYKPHAEFMMFGYAKTSEPKLTWEVSAQIGEWKKAIQVYGPRYWDRGDLSWKLQRPQHTQSACVDYRGAYGGSFELSSEDTSEAPVVVAYRQNPGGRGWLGANHGQNLTRFQTRALESQTSVYRVLAPNIEEVRLLRRELRPNSAATPFAFGSFPPWAPQRLELLEAMKPIAQDQKGYPDDFPPIYWMQSSSDQWIRDKSVGGSTLTLCGVLGQQSVQYRIPKESALIYVQSPEVLNETLKTEVDTVIVDLDQQVLQVIERRLVKITGLTRDIKIDVVNRVA